MSGGCALVPELDVPGGRGPVPKPFSQEHADRVPEITRKGGTLGFAHDVGMMFGSPVWYVNGREVRQRDCLVELLKDRGIDDTQKEAAAQVALDFVLAYYIPNVVHSKPDCWDQSTVLSKAQFQEASVELLENPKQQQSTSPCYSSNLTVARITYWISEEKQTLHANFSDGKQVELPPNPTQDHRKIWELKYFDVLVTALRTGKYDDEKVGYIFGGGRMHSVEHCTLKTTPDGLSPYLTNT